MYLFKVTGATFAGISMLFLHLEWDQKLLAPSSKMACDDSLLCSAFMFRENFYLANRQREGSIVVDVEDALTKLMLTTRSPPVVFKFTHNFCSDQQR